MREHEYYQELMSRLLDEGLTEEEEAALREHMRTCPECQRLGMAFTGISSALREELAEPPEDLVRGVMERIRDEEPSAARTPKAPRSGRHLRLWVRLGAAACLVLLIAGVSTVALRGRTKDASQETADVRSADMAAAQARSAGAADNGGQPMNASAEGGEAVSGQDDVPMAISEPIEEDAAAPVPAPSPSQEPLPVYDAARNHVGTIAPENIPAFEALITDEGWAEGSFEYMLRVEYRGRTYAFASDEAGDLVWWEEPSTQPLRSPGTFAQLHGLITLEAPALPQ